MEPHGQNHWTDGVLANGQHPTRQERYENTETRGTKTVPKMNLVNPERIWYVSVHLGVPPSHQFRKTGYGWNALFFQPFFHYPTIQSTQKRRNYRYNIDRALHHSEGQQMQRLRVIRGNRVVYLAAPLTE